MRNKDPKVAASLSKRRKKRLRLSSTAALLALIGVGVIGGTYFFSNKTIKADTTAVNYLSSNYQRTPIPANDANGVALFNDIGRYSVQSIGGSNTVGYDTGEGLAPSLVYKDYDDDPTTFSSTSMDFVPKGKIVKAYLYFFQVGARSQESPSNRKNTFILGPKGGRFAIDTGFEDVVYDVTDFVTNEGQGTYWGKNIDNKREEAAGSDNIANWSITFVEEDEELPLRKSIVNAFNRYVYGNHLVTDFSSGVPIPLLSTSSPSFTLTGVVQGGNYSLEGDKLITESFLDNQSLVRTEMESPIRPKKNFFRGQFTDNDSDSTVNRKPNDVYKNNIDVFNYDLDNASYFPQGLNNVKVSYLSDGADGFYPSILGGTFDIDRPEYTLQFSDDADSSSEIKIGDLNRKVTLNVNKKVNDNVAVYEKAMELYFPEGSEYVQGSLKVNGSMIDNSRMTSAGQNKWILDLEGLANVENDFAIELNMNASQTFKVGNLKANYTGKLIYNKNEKTPYALKYESNSLFYYSDVTTYDEQYALRANNFAVSIGNVKNNLNVKKLAEMVLYDRKTSEILDSDTVDSGKVVIDQTQLDDIKSAQDKYTQRAGNSEHPEVEDYSDIIKPYPLTMTYTYSDNGTLKTLERIITVFVTNETTKVAKSQNKVIYAFGFRYPLRKAAQLDDVDIVDMSHAEAWNYDNVWGTGVAETTGFQTNRGAAYDPINESLTGVNNARTTGQYELALTHGSVVNDYSVIELYAEIAKLNVRQIVLEPNAELVTSTEGYIKLKNIENPKAAITPFGVDPGEPVGPSIPDEKAAAQEVYVRSESGTDVTKVAYELVKLPIHYGYYFYQADVVVPEYYQYIGFELTDSSNQTGNVTGTGMPQINYIGETEEYWLTMYIKPSLNGNESPGFYHWDYGQEDTYTIVE